MFEGSELGALLEPRRIQALPGYYSTKCVSAGMFTLIGHRILKEAGGLPRIPTEVTARVIVYQVIRYRVLIYFIDEAFVRAVAATDLPHDFTLDDLHWPMIRTLDMLMAIDCLRAEPPSAPLAPGAGKGQRV